MRTFVFLCSKEQTAMPIRTLLLSLWWLLPAALHAQQVLVCDGATRFPIRDVLVSADGKPAGHTTWQGYISLSGPFQTASFQKKGYVPEKLLREEVLRDTVFLFPAAHYLDEVVVVGKQTVDGRGMLKKMPKRTFWRSVPRAAWEGSTWDSCSTNGTDATADTWNSCGRSSRKWMDLTKRKTPS